LTPLRRMVLPAVVGPLATLAPGILIRASRGPASP
jgi:hypothetical protein